MANKLLNIFYFAKTKNCFISILIFFSFLGDIFGQINIKITARVDTTNVEIKSVYNLWVNYLNSRPDSVYVNPFWLPSEVEYYFNAGMPSFDMAAMFMFRGYDSSNQFLEIYKPTVLSIEKHVIKSEEAFVIKTLFYSNKYAEHPTYSKFNPPYITKYYCTKKNGAFYLCNAIDYETAYWNRYEVGFITYICHPSITFDADEANAALTFCNDIVKQYNLQDPSRISFFIAPDESVMGNLYNFEYWLSYSTGMAHTPINRIALTYPIFCHKHELAHLLFVSEEWNTKGRPFIVNEGLATFIGGSSKTAPFEEELQEFSKQIQDTVITLDDILSQRYVYPNPYHNHPIYMVGGFIFKLVYEKHKEEGVLKLFGCGRKQEDFQTVIEALFDMSYNEFETYIIQQLKKITH